jgi:hypothetical protein
VDRTDLVLHITTKLRVRGSIECPVPGTFGPRSSQLARMKILKDHIIPNLSNKEHFLSSLGYYSDDAVAPGARP